EEDGLSEREHPGVAPQEIEPQGEDGEGQVLAEEIQVVVGDQARRVQERQAHREDGAKDRERGQAGAAPHGPILQHHAPDAAPAAPRPGGAKRPVGRHWRNQITTASTATFAYTAAAVPPMAGSRSLLMRPSPKAATTVPIRLATPPSTTTMNESTM